MYTHIYIIICNVVVLIQSIRNRRRIREAERLRNTF